MDSLCLREHINPKREKERRSTDFLTEKKALVGVVF